MTYSQVLGLQNHAVADVHKLSNSFFSSTHTQEAGTGIVICHPRGVLFYTSAEENTEGSRKGLEGEKRGLLKGSECPAPSSACRAVFPALPCKFQAVGEAALAANLIMAWKTVWGSCTSSRLDHLLMEKYKDCFLYDDQPASKMWV